MTFELIEVPLMSFFDMGEKRKIKLPIARNDHGQSKRQRIYGFLTPEEVRAERGRPFFTAPYQYKYFDW